MIADTSVAVAVVVVWLLILLLMLSLLLLLLLLLRFLCASTGEASKYESWMSSNKYMYFFFWRQREHIKTRNLVYCMYIHL